MGNDILRDLQAIMAIEAFKSLLGAANLKIAEVHAILDLLIKAGIPFDFDFSPGGRRLAAASELTIYINPTTTLHFVINYEGGASVFTFGPNE